MTTQKPSGTGQRYSLTESESRVRLDATRFSTHIALLKELERAFPVTLIKRYAFKDTYFGREGVVDTNGEVTRIRKWSTYVLGDGTEVPQPIQIIRSTVNIVVQDGIPFNVGGKKSKQEVRLLSEATKILSAEGQAAVLGIEKDAGTHIRVDLGAGAEVRVACELVTFNPSPTKVNNSARLITASYLEIEVESVDPETVSAKVAALMSFLGAPTEALIGHPMVIEAQIQLKLIERP